MPKSISYGWIIHKLIYFLLFFKILVMINLVRVLSQDGSLYYIYYIILFMLVKYCTNVSINKSHVLLSHIVAGHDYINCSLIHNSFLEFFGVFWSFSEFFGILFHSYHHCFLLNTLLNTFRLIQTKFGLLPLASS